MPRYFFHVRQKDTLFEDRRGAVFADLAAASIWAVKDAADLRQSGAVTAEMRELSIEIGDAKGTILTTLPFEEMALD